MKKLFLAIACFSLIALPAIGGTQDGQTAATPQVQNESAQAKTAEKMPSFPGGEGALMKFIKKNLKYPTYAAENGIQGRVSLEFIVKKNGSIKKIKAVKSPHPTLSKEAIRVVKAMPKWEPGTVDGEPVDVKFVLPVTFRLQ